MFAFGAQRGKEAVARLEQPEKALPPMFVTLEKEATVMLLQLLKALLPIEVAFGHGIAVRLAQELNV